MSENEYEETDERQKFLDRNEKLTIAMDDAGNTILKKDGDEFDEQCVICHRWDNGALGLSPICNPCNDFVHDFIDFARFSGEFPVRQMMEEMLKLMKHGIMPVISPERKNLHCDRCENMHANTYSRGITRNGLFVAYRSPSTNLCNSCLINESKLHPQDIYVTTIRKHVQNGEVIQL